MINIFFEIFNNPFLAKSIFSLFLISFLFSIWGMFIILRRMSFYAESLSHSTLFVISLSYLLNLNSLILIILWSIVFSFLIYYFSKNKNISQDNILAFLFIFGISLGIIIFSISSINQSKIFSALFGNILLVQKEDIIILSILTILCLLFFIYNFKNLILISINQELAYVDSININKIMLYFYILLSLSIVMGLKLIGVVLVNSLLILPALSSKLISKSLKSMIFLTIIISLGISLFGFIISIIFNLPIGSTIALIGSLVFILFSISKKFL
jgi:zinc transport system permease protein